MPRSAPTIAQRTSSKVTYVGAKSSADSDPLYPQAPTVVRLGNGGGAIADWTPSWPGDKPPTASGSTAAGSQARARQLGQATSPSQLNTRATVMAMPRNTTPGLNNQQGSDWTPASPNNTPPADATRQAVNDAWASASARGWQMRWPGDTPHEVRQAMAANGQKQKAQDDLLRGVSSDALVANKQATQKQRDEISGKLDAIRSSYGMMDANLTPDQRIAKRKEMFNDANYLHLSDQLEQLDKPGYQAAADARRTVRNTMNAQQSGYNGAMAEANAVQAQGDANTRANADSNDRLAANLAERDRYEQLTPGVVNQQDLQNQAQQTANDYAPGMYEADIRGTDAKSNLANAQGAETSARAVNEMTGRGGNQQSMGTIARLQNESAQHRARADNAEKQIKGLEDQMKVMAALLKEKGVTVAGSLGSSTPPGGGGSGNQGGGGSTPPPAPGSGAPNPPAPNPPVGNGGAANNGQGVSSPTTQPSIPTVTRDQYQKMMQDGSFPPNFVYNGRTLWFDGSRAKDGNWGVYTQPPGSNNR